MTGPTVARRHIYRELDLTVPGEKERFTKKGFRWRRPDGQGGWTFGLGGVEMPLYRLPELVAAVKAGKWVLVVEGEKDVESLERIGRVATTNPDGAGKWRSRFNEYFRGAKVGIICDNDDPGRKHALMVACELDSIAAEVRVYSPPEEFKDVSEMLEKGVELKRLRPFSRSAWQAIFATQNGNGNGNGNGRVNGNGHRKLMLMSAKDFCARPAPAQDERLLGPLLWRKCRHVVGAHTGAGKTTIACQLCYAVLTGDPFLRPDWRAAKGGRVLFINLEQGEERTKQRFREVGLDTVDGIDLLHEPDGLALDRNPDEVRQVKGILKDGRYDLVVFDPFYQLSEGDEVDQVEAKKLSRLVDGWARDYGFASLVPMHRRKPQGPVINHNQFSIHEIAGISTWLRNAEVVLGLQMVNHGYSWLHWFKDRPGFLPPVGGHWALAFDAETHTYHLTEEREATWRQVRPLLEDAPGMTTAEVAEALGRAIPTTHAALKRVGAHDDGGHPVAERRWQMEPWPSLQTMMFSEKFNEEVEVNGNGS